MFNVVDDCSKCKLNTDTYELLQVGTGFWSGEMVKFGNINAYKNFHEVVPPFLKV